MANKKILDLTAASALTGVEKFECVQGGVNKQVSGSSILNLIIENEVPTGSVNDVNTNFTLANTPIAGSVKVFLNGLRMKPTTDYTVSGTTITFLIAPTTGDTILCDYRR